eukprot:TRINITY_DN1032_c0_g1_i3.p2 TRINITY_DN1032_c0_g1~~TRINITY_DN1032_c0_g1_i3.p2  ORF type:complete len:135 (+),score=12.16 TRINITY_DN1032_c0_g1_i3:1296-1700(+)
MEFNEVVSFGGQRISFGRSLSTRPPRLCILTHFLHFLGDSCFWDGGWEFGEAICTGLCLIVVQFFTRFVKYFYHLCICFSGFEGVFFEALEAVEEGQVFFVAGGKKVIIVHPFAGQLQEVLEAVDDRQVEEIIH